jgi:hypothetical protein
VRECEGQREREGERQRWRERKDMMKLQEAVVKRVKG